LRPVFLFYRPRRNEMIAPKPPINRKLAINNPSGIRLGRCVSSTNVGNASGAGGVYVTNRVGVTGGMRGATSGGLIVGVEAAVGVGRISTSGRFEPLDRET